MGKDYERYYERAKADYGIEYKRSAVSSIKELQQTKNLLITYVKEDGTFEEKEFDAVVLSVGFTPPKAIKDLAQQNGSSTESAGVLPDRRVQSGANLGQGNLCGRGFSGSQGYSGDAWSKARALRHAAASFLPPIVFLNFRKEYPAEGALGDEIPKDRGLHLPLRGGVEKEPSISELIERDKAVERGGPC